MKKLVFTLILSLILIVPVGLLQAEESSDPYYVKSPHRFVEAGSQIAQEKLETLLSRFEPIATISNDEIDEFRLIELGALPEDLLDDVRRFEPEEIKELIEDIPAQYLEHLMDPEGRFFALPNLYAAQSQAHLKGLDMKELAVEVLNGLDMEFRLDLSTEELALAMYPAEDEVEAEVIKEQVEILDTKSSEWKLSDSAINEINFEDGVAIGRVFINASRLHETALVIHQDLTEDEVTDIIQALIEMKDLVLESTLVYLPEDISEPVLRSADDILQAARDVLAGKYGDGKARFDALIAAKFDPEAVQEKVNSLIRSNLETKSFASDLTQMGWESLSEVVDETATNSKASTQGTNNTTQVSEATEEPLPIETTQTFVQSTTATTIATEPSAPKTLQEIKLEYIGWDDPKVFMFWSLDEAKEFGNAKFQESYEEVNKYNLLPGKDKQDYVWTNFMDVNGYTGWEAHTIQQGIAVLSFY